ncbi:MAG TPA: FtsW/RodA/SpoVE family cell cycle protein [Acidimicrobiales bacterium]|nr:FtsW/RodA/SpoVE family cell cycle protein [Acidimicrobiales bacterium]
MAQGIATADDEHPGRQRNWTATLFHRSSASRRRTELGLLLLAGASTTGAYVLASLGRSGSIPGNLAPFLVVIIGLSIVAHVANRLLAPDCDPVILPVATLLNGLGYVMIARLDPHLAGLQADWSALGVGAYVATLLLIRRSRDLDRYRYLLALAGGLLMLTPLLPHFGQDINGARLWVRLGPVTFQPVEFAKIALAIFFASYLVEKKEMMSTPTVRIGNRLVTDPRPFGPVLLAWLASLVIMSAERDIGFSTLVFAMFVAMLWMSTDRIMYLAVFAMLLVLGAFVASHLFPQVNERIANWLNPWSHAATTGYQVIQGEYAMGSGGIAGTGLGLGHPGYVPVSVSDYIFSSFGEELGLLGTTSILIGFLLIMGSGIRIATRARTPFASLLAAGLTVTISLQAFFIMGGVVRLLPFTGLALPFVAYGGSSLLANYVLIALLMRISDESARARSDTS